MTPEAVQVACYLLALVLLIVLFARLGRESK